VPRVATPPGPEVSVVVATRNRSAQLAALLDSLRAQTLPRERFELIVVDDASSDDTARVLDGVSDLPLQAIRRDTSGGPAGARNDGWRAASAPLVAFTDDDCVVEPEWLEAALAAHRDAPSSLLQGPVSPDPAAVEGRSALTRTIVVDKLGPYFQTCNVFYPRALLEQLDGFDPSLERGEDADLAWRAIESGVEPVWVPEAHVHHAVNTLSLTQLLRLAIKWAPSMEVYVRHPQLREQVFNHGIFWKPQHYMLARALVALVLPRRLRSFALLLAWPYLMYLVKPQNRAEGGGPFAAPILALYDLVELTAVGAWSLRHRKLLL
jgi:glycosyltransferase involved in cell wall biosynthesis